MLPASALLVAEPGTCFSTMGVFLSVAGTPGFGFQSTLWAPLVVFHSQEDRFLVCCFREVWVACVCAELGNGTGRDFGLGLLQVWIVGLYNWLLHSVLQLLYSPT